MEIYYFFNFIKFNSFQQHITTAACLLARCVVTWIEHRIKFARVTDRAHVVFVHRYLRFAFVQLSFFLASQRSHELANLQDLTVGHFFVCVRAREEEESGKKMEIRLEKLKQIVEVKLSQIFNILNQC